jgi:dihydrofolate reductase
MSLDAFIAGPQGEVDWCFSDQDYGMKEFYSSIDTVLMGRKTYEFGVSHGARSYPGVTNIVFSPTLRASEYPEVTVVAADAGETIEGLRNEDGKDIWLVGGGQIFHAALRAGCVDDVIVAVHPILLGDGIPLLPAVAEVTQLELTDTTPYDTGLVTMWYRVKQ